MNNINKRCLSCGELLKHSLIARVKPEGMPAIKAKDDLVCFNSPKCPKAQKVVKFFYIDFDENYEELKPGPANAWTKRVEVFNFPYNSFKAKQLILDEFKKLDRVGICASTVLFTISTNDGNTNVADGAIDIADLNVRFGHRNGDFLDLN